MKTTWHVALTIGLLACFCCSTADAAKIRFDAIGEGYWDDYENWEGDVVPQPGPCCFRFDLRFRKIGG